MSKLYILILLLTPFITSSATAQENTPDGDTHPKTTPKVEVGGAVGFGASTGSGAEIFPIAADAISSRVTKAMFTADNIINIVPGSFEAGSNKTAWELKLCGGYAFSKRLKMRVNLGIGGFKSSAQQKFDVTDVTPAPSPTSTPDTQTKTLAVRVILPVKYYIGDIGIRYHFGKTQQVFFGIGATAGLITGKTTYEINSNRLEKNISYSQTQFGGTAEIGMQIPMEEHLMFEPLINTHFLSSAGNFYAIPTLNIGIIYQIGK